MQAQTYSAGYSSALVIPQSKVDLTSPVNEFAYKVGLASVCAAAAPGCCAANARPRRPRARRPAEHPPNRLIKRSPSPGTLHGPTRPAQVKEWDQRREGMDIAVRHLLQRQLPDWVRPQPPAPAPAAAAAEPAAAEPAAAAAGAAPAAAAQQQQPQQLAGTKRATSEGAEAEEQAAAKRQQAAAPAAAAAANGAEPPSRSTSDLQVQEVQQQAGDGQQAPVTAAGAAETAAERQAASQEAQLAGRGELGEWTVLRENGAGAAELAAEDGAPPLQQAAAAAKSKPIAVK